VLRPHSFEHLHQQNVRPRTARKDKPRLAWVRSLQRRFQKIQLSTLEAAAGAEISTRKRDSPTYFQGIVGARHHQRQPLPRGERARVRKRKRRKAAAAGGPNRNPPCLPDQGGAKILGEETLQSPRGNEYKMRGVKGEEGNEGGRYSKVPQSSRSAVSVVHTRKKWGDERAWGKLREALTP